MFRFRGDAGKTNVVAEFLDEPGLIFLQIVEDSLHRRFVARPARRSKVAAAPIGARQRPRSGAAKRRSVSPSYLGAPLNRSKGLMPPSFSFKPGTLSTAFSSSAPLSASLFSSAFGSPSVPATLMKSGSFAYLASGGVPLGKRWIRCATARRA